MIVAAIGDAAGNLIQTVIIILLTFEKYHYLDHL